MTTETPAKTRPPVSDAVLRLLASHPEIETAAVVDRCAYVSAGHDLDPVELREYLSQHLRDDELPSHILQVPSVQSGELPEPSTLEYGHYRPPADQVEAALVAIWQEMLGRTKLGVLDNFFAVGGDSLAAAALTRHLAEAFGVNLNMVQVLQAPTIIELAATVRAGLAAGSAQQG